MANNIDQEYQTNLEILLEKIRENTASTSLTAESLALDVHVDGLETLQGATNDLLTTIDADTGAMVIDLDAIETLLTAANLDHAANEALLILIEATLETIKLDTEDIETATEASAVSLAALDNAVDGNYLNVNANIAGTDFVGGAGAVASGVQRTTLASDDPAVVKLGEIETTANAIQASVEALDNAISGSEMQVDVVTTALPSGAATESTLSAAEVHLGNIDDDTGAIKTAVEALDNAVDGNFLNVNANIAGTDIVGGAGNVAAGVQRVALATDDVPTALINTNLVAIEATLTAIETDSAANEVLLGKIRDNQLLMLGNSGSVTISGTTVVDVSGGTYCALYFIRDTNPSTLVVAGSTCITGVEYPAGTWLYGDITDITANASSALYILYKGNPS